MKHWKVNLQEIQNGFEQGLLLLDGSVGPMVEQMAKLSIFVSISITSKPLTCQCPTYDLDTIFWQTIFNHEDFCKQSLRVALIVRGIPSMHRQLQ